MAFLRDLLAGFTADLTVVRPVALDSPVTEVQLDSRRARRVRSL
jgi:hypothetical protein